MSCFCCKNSFLVCIEICSNEPTIILLPFLTEASKVYVLHLEYLGGIKKIEQLQVANTNFRFSFLPMELNEDYCYTAKIFDTFGNIINFDNSNEFDCLNICTKLSL